MSISNFSSLDFNQLNQHFQQILMYQHLLDFLNLLLLQNKINLIQIWLFILKISVLENIHSFILCLFINPTVKWTIIAFPFNIQFIFSFLYYFFNSKLLLICFLQFLFVKRSKNFFALEITNTICPRHSVFNFFNHKNICRPIWNIAFFKNAFGFWNLNFKFNNIL